MKRHSITLGCSSEQNSPDPGNGAEGLTRQPGYKIQASGTVGEPQVHTSWKPQQYKYKSETIEVNVCVLFGKITANATNYRGIVVVLYFNELTLRKGEKTYPGIKVILVKDSC